MTPMLISPPHPNAPQPPAGTCQRCGHLVEPHCVPILGWRVDPHCADCRRVLAAEAEHRQKEHTFQELVCQANLSPRFHTKTFAAFDPTVNDSVHNAYQIAKTYAETFGADTTDGLCFIGPRGSGKTHLACAIAFALIARWVETETRQSVRFLTAPELFLAINPSFGNTSKVRSEEIIERYAEARLFIVDDLGAEKPSERVREIMFVLLDRRYGQLRPTIFTTNSPLPQLRYRLGERITSRITDMCQVVTIERGDYRTTQRLPSKQIDSVSHPQHV